MSLRIPRITEDMDTLAAALAYARCGWYVIPVKADTKAPTVLGKDWPSQSSRDADVIVSWFAGADHALGLHVGRSGAVAFDVDMPTYTPEPLLEAIKEAKPPHQSTRSNEVGRGHYVFATDRRLGNGRGKLLHPDHGGKWGEVRGANGIIVVEPSIHSKPGGRYEWLLPEGEDALAVPPMPHYLDVLLPDGTKTETAATDAEVDKILRTYVGETKPSALRTILSAYESALASGSRHEATVQHLPWALREAIAGFFPARTAVDNMRSMFLAAPGSHQNRADEFDNILAWAVGQVTTVDGKKIAQDVEARLAMSEMQRATPEDFFGEADSTPVEAGSPPPPPAGPLRDPEDYFPFDAGTRRSEFNPVVLARDIFALGPLAVGHDRIFWSYADGVWKQNEHAVRERCTRLMQHKYRPTHRNTVEDVVRHSPALGYISGDPLSELINFRNGMLDWRTGELKPHSPKYYSITRIPIDWDAEATCPHFEEWLESILSPDYVALMWELIGYLLMSGNPLQIAALFIGKGRNGKGTLMRVLANMLGHDNISALDLDDLSESRFAAATLFGKTANFAGDIDATFQESTKRFKKLTGGDPYQAEYKGKDHFRFTSWAVPVFSANKIPGTSDLSEGYTRRWIIVKFERMISAHEQILDLDKQFLDELPGIAARGVRALRVVMDRGYLKDDGEIAIGKAEFVEEIDQVRQFIDQWCELDPDGGDERSAIYVSYKMWADKNGAGKLSAKEFYHRMENIPGIIPLKVNGVRRLRGVRVKATPVLGVDQFMTDHS